MAFCWPAGLSLARALLAHPQWVRGKRVVDFGCGSGVAGLAALRAGAEVTFCDLDPDALLAARENAALNGLEARTCGDWAELGPVDLVLATDVLYDQANHVWLDRFLEKASEAVVADCRESRLREPYRELWREEGHPVPDMDICGEFRFVQVWAAGNFTI